MSNIKKLCISILKNKIHIGSTAGIGICMSYYPKNNRMRRQFRQLLALDMFFGKYLFCIMLNKNSIVLSWCNYYETNAGE